MNKTLALSRLYLNLKEDPYQTGLKQQLSQYKINDIRSNIGTWFGVKAVSKDQLIDRIIHSAQDRYNSQDYALTVKQRFEQDVKQASNSQRINNAEFKYTGNYEKMNKKETKVIFKRHNWQTKIKLINPEADISALASKLVNKLKGEYNPILKTMAATLNYRFPYAQLGIKIKIGDQVRDRYVNIMQVKDKQGNKLFHQIDLLRTLAPESRYSRALALIQQFISHLNGEITNIIFQANSNKIIEGDAQVDFTLSYRPAPITGGAASLSKSKVPKFKMETYFKYEGLLRLDNTDTYCLPRSIVISAPFVVLKFMLSHHDHLLPPTEEINDALKLLAANNNDPHKISNEQQLKFKKVMFYNQVTQITFAQALAHSAQVIVDPQAGCNFDDLERFEQFLKIDIPVFIFDEVKAKVIHNKHSFGHYYPIFYEQSDSQLGHFYPVHKPYKLMNNADFYCFTCDKGSKDRKRHINCKPKKIISATSSSCLTCGSENCPTRKVEFAINDANIYTCDKCGVKCYDIYCYNYHQSSFCSQRMHRNDCCKICGVKLNSFNGQTFDQAKIKHRCGYGYCMICHSNHELTYDGDKARCMIQQVSKTQRWKFICFDFEARQETGTHVMNYCVAERITIQAAKIEDEELIKLSGKKTLWQEIGEPTIEKFTFENNGDCVVDQFCQWLFTPENADSTVIAHYGKGYDFQPIYAYCNRDKNKTVHASPIFQGAKLMSLTIHIGDFTQRSPSPKDPSLRLVDSLNHVGSPLSQFPKLFGLDSSKFAKGYFPHFFNTKDNWNYRGPLPDMKYFNPDLAKSIKDKAKFVDWWHKESLKYNDDHPWDFQEQMKYYCESDVRILTEGMLAYRKSIRSITKPLKAKQIAQIFKDKTHDELERITDILHCFDPLSSITIASTSLHTMLELCYDNKDVRVAADDNGRSAYLEYVKNQRRYYNYLKSTNPNINYDPTSRPINTAGLYFATPIDTAGVCTEKTINGKVYHCLLSCTFHGCPTCYPRESHMPPHTGKLRHILTRDTEIMTAPENNDGFRVITVFECKVRDIIRSEQYDIKEGEFNHSKRTITRDLLYGGRTQPTKLMVEGKKLAYSDITSLYPFVLQNRSFPIGQATHYSSDIGDLPFLNPVTKLSPALLTSLYLHPPQNKETFIALVAKHAANIDLDPVNLPPPINIEEEYVNYLENPIKQPSCLTFTQFLTERNIPYNHASRISDIESTSAPIFRDENNPFRPFVQVPAPIDFVWPLYLSYCNEFNSRNGDANPSLHEVIVSDTRQRVRFDIDISDPIFASDFFRGQPHAYQLLNLIIQACEKVAQEYNYLNTYFETGAGNVVCKSHRQCSVKPKVSFHILTNIICQDSKTAAEFADKVYKLVDHHPLAKYIDKEVHKSTQNFRMPYSAKKSEPMRMKEIDLDFHTMHVDQYTCAAEPDDLETSLPLVGIYDANFASFPIFRQWYYEHQTNYDPDSNPSALYGALYYDHRFNTIKSSTMHKAKGKERVACDYVPPHLLELLKQSVDNFEQVWSFRDCRDNIYSFDRNQPSYCSICKRNHESDNTLYLTDSDAGVYLHCRKSKSSIQLQAKTLTRPLPQAQAQPIKSSFKPKPFVRPDLKVYSIFDIYTGKSLSHDKSFSEYLIAKYPHQFIPISENSKFYHMSEREAKFFEEHHFYDWQKALISSHVLITPPSNLYHPILPRRFNGKTVFDLEQRKGSYTHPELKLALEHGYQIDHVYSADIHADSSPDLFKAYISSFMSTKVAIDKIKDLYEEYDEQGKANPIYGDDGQINEEALKTYFAQWSKEHKEHDGIDLDYKFFLTLERTGNPGLRSVAKLLLNSLWGKFGYNPRKSKTTSIMSHQQFDELLQNENIDPATLKIDAQNDGETAIARYELLFTDAGINNATNIYIAAYTTAYARSYLWSYLQKLGERVVYCDTDSIVYIIDECSYNIPTSSYVGDFKSELKPGEYITSFRSTGPKSYAYKTNKEEANFKKALTILGPEVIRSDPYNPGKFVHLYPDSSGEANLKTNLSADDLRDNELFKLWPQQEQLGTHVVRNKDGFVYVDIFPTEECTLKAKGITLDINNSIGINYNTFKDVIEHQLLMIYDAYINNQPFERKTIKTKPNIKPTIKKSQIVNNKEYSKIFQLTFDKAYIILHLDSQRQIKEVDTLPYGYDIARYLAYHPDALVIDPRYC